MQKFTKDHQVQPKINKHSAADPNACALCFCLGYFGPFVRDASPKSIDREGLGESRTGTRQVIPNGLHLLTAEVAEVAHVN